MNSRTVNRWQPVLGSVAAAILVASGITALGPPAVALADVPPGGTLVASLPVVAPRDVHAAFGSIWLSNGPARTVTRFDPATNAVQAVVAVPDPASVLADGGGSIWLTSVPGDSLTRIDPATNTVTGTISLEPGGDTPVAVTFYAGYVWVADHDGMPTGAVSKIDPATMAVLDVIPVGPLSFAGPNWIAGAAGSIWVDVPNIPGVVRLDPSTDAILATIPDKGSCGGLAANDTGIWVAGGGGPGCLPGITRIDPATNTLVASLNAGGQTNPVALGTGTLWFGTEQSRFLGRVDTASDTVVGQLKLPGPTFGLAVGYGYVWVSDRVDGRLFKVLPS